MEMAVREEESLQSYDFIHSAHGDEYRPVDVTDEDSDEDSGTEPLGGKGEGEEEDIGHCPPSTLRWGLLIPLLVLALIGLLAVTASLVSIRLRCEGREEGWQCWQRSAVTQWMPPLSSFPPPPSSSTSLPSLSSSPLPPSFTWTPSSSPVSSNVVRMARLFDRLERGLPIVVGAIGGSNMQGNALNWTETVLPVLTWWLNEHFPVKASDVEGLEADRAASVQRDCGNRTRGGGGGLSVTEQSPSRHVFVNTAVGGTTSGLTSFCYRRLITQCDFPDGTYTNADRWSYHDPDLLLIDFAVNDVIDDDPFSASPPSTNIERLVRQVLGHTTHTAVVMVYFAMLLTYGLRSGEHIHHPISTQYHLPEVSFRKFAMDWLYEPQYEFNRFNYLDDLKEQRPVPLELPLPFVEALKKVNGGQHINMDSLFWYNGYHLNELGHRILVALASRELLILYRALRTNAYTSFADPTQLPEGLTASLPSLIDPHTVDSARLPPPISTELAVLDAQEFTCTVMYHPYNPKAGELDQSGAERFMSVDRNEGWLYARHGQSNKFAMAIPEANALSVDQHLRMALPSTIHSLSAVFVRSWNASMMGEARMWLSCEEEGESSAALPPLPTPPFSPTSRATPPILLNGSWAQPNTQLDLLQIWPLQKTGQSLGTTGGAVESYQRPSCDLRFGHLRHTKAGEFRFVGIVWN